LKASHATPAIQLHHILGVSLFCNEDVFGFRRSVR